MIAYAQTPDLVGSAILLVGAVAMVAVGIRSIDRDRARQAEQARRAHAETHPPRAHVDVRPRPYDWSTEGEWNPFPWPLDAEMPADLFHPEIRTVRDLVDAGYRPTAGDPFTIERWTTRREEARDGEIPGLWRNRRTPGL